MIRNKVPAIAGLDTKRESSSRSLKMISKRNPAHKRLVRSQDALKNQDRSPRNKRSVPKAIVKVKSADWSRYA